MLYSKREVFEVVCPSNKNYNKLGVVLGDEKCYYDIISMRGTLIWINAEGSLVSWTPTPIPRRTEYTPHYYVLVGDDKGWLARDEMSKLLGSDIKDSDVVQ